VLAAISFSFSDEEQADLSVFQGDLATLDLDKPSLLKGELEKTGFRLFDRNMIFGNPQATIRKIIDSQYQEEVTVIS